MKKLKCKDRRAASFGLSAFLRQVNRRFLVVGTRVYLKNRFALQPKLTSDQGISFGLTEVHVYNLPRTYPETAQKLPRNSPETFQNLPRNCLKCVQRLTRNWQGTVQKLPRNCLESAQKLARTCQEPAKSRPRTFPETAQKLPRKSGSERVYKQSIVQVNLFLWYTLVTGWWPFRKFHFVAFRPSNSFPASSKNFELKMNALCVYSLIYQNL